MRITSYLKVTTGDGRLRLIDCVSLKDESDDGAAT
jgi:hypothetical protein